MAHSPIVGSSKKTLSRIRGGGVVISKARMIKEATKDGAVSLVEHRKLRIAGLPNRKAANTKKGLR